jgi:antitoxin ParD1/3/4
MDVTLKPEARAFVEDQIRAGRYGSAEDVVAEAVSRMMADSDVDLDEETAAAINRAEAQLDRGEGIDFDRFAAEMRRRIGTR